MAHPETRRSTRPGNDPRHRRARGRIRRDRLSCHQRPPRRGPRDARRRAPARSRAQLHDEPQRARSLRGTNRPRRVGDAVGARRLLRRDPLGRPRGRVRAGAPHGALHDAPRARPRGVPPRAAGGRHDRRRRSSCFRRSRATSSWPCRRAASRSSLPTRASPWTRASPPSPASHRAGAKAATDHLLALGHRRIGHVSGRQGWAATEERLEGYHTALAAAGVLPTSDLVVEGTYRGGQRLRRGERSPRPAEAADRDLRGKRQHGRGRAPSGARARDRRSRTTSPWSASTTPTWPRS